MFRWINPKSAIFLGLIFMACSAHAADDAKAMELLNKNGCLACHDIHTKVVGPAYADVAAKYRDKPEMVDALVKKVINGGKGTWGRIPMPPNNVTEDEARILVNWVLSH